MITGRGALLLTCYALLAGGLLGCGAITGNSASPASGIRGRTMVDAGCPMVKDGSPCPDHAIEAKVTVRREGDTVAEVVSDRQGQFSVRLSPGTYELEAGSPTGGPVPFAAPRPVIVGRGAYTTVTVTLDSGVR